MDFVLTMAVGCNFNDKFLNNHPSNSYIIPNVDNINTMNKIFADNLGSNRLLENSGC